MFSTDGWATVRIPLQLHGRLNKLATRMESAWDRGHGGIPPSDATGKVTPWQVIERAIDEYEEHLRRSGE